MSKGMNTRLDKVEAMRGGADPDADAVEMSQRTALMRLAGWKPPAGKLTLQEVRRQYRAMGVMEIAECQT